MTIELRIAPFLLPAALALVIGIASPAAGAELPLFVALDYRADDALAGCPTEAEFRTMVGTQLGYDPFRERSELTVIARAESTGQGIRGFVTWHDASDVVKGERELASSESDCSAIARAMSFAIAVQIQLLDLEARSAPVDSERPMASEQPGASRAAEPPSGARTRDAVPVPELPPRDGGGWQFALGIGPALALGVAPRMSVAGQVFAGATLDAFSLELGAEASLPSRHATADGEGFEQQHAHGSLASCVTWRALSGCAMSKLGVLAIRGFGVDVPRSPSGMVARVGPRLVLTEPLAGRWFGRLHVEGLVSLASWRVTLNRNEVWATPRFSMAVGGELAALFQ